MSWHPEAPDMLRRRGDLVWYYGAPPGVSKPSAAITRFAFQAWLWGVNGYVHWLAVDPGEDPWFHFEDGQTALVYPGERFGVEGPIPSIRLKLQRNCLQDLALLDSFKAKHSLATLRREAATRFNHSKPEDWWNRTPAFTKLPPSEWRGSDFDAAVEKTTKMTSAIDARAWDRVHEFVLELAAEEK